MAEHEIIVVTGSRSWRDIEMIRRRLLELKPETVIVGGASGADLLTEKVCQDEGIHCVVVKAEWEKYGKSAGFIRNGKMLRTVDVNRVVAFWDEKSPGTKNCLDQADKLGIYWEINTPEGYWYDSETWAY